MGVPYITSFFWCISLQTGTKLISFLHLAWALFVIVACSILASEARARVGTPDDDERVYSRAFAAATAVAVASVAHLLLACVLMYSAFKLKAWGLRCWVWMMLALFLGALGYVVTTPIVYGFTASGSEIFLYFLEGLLLFAFIAYCILCVNSFYLMLKSSEDMDGPNKTNY